MAQLTTIESPLLITAVQRVQGALIDKNAASIGIRMGQGRMNVFASDKVLAIYTSVEVATSGEMDIFLPGKMLTEVVKSLPVGPVTLSVEVGYLLLSMVAPTQFHMRIPLLVDQTWREEPVTEETPSQAKIPSHLLKYMIEQVAFCISQDFPRNFGTVGFFHSPTPGKLRLVGTDSFRLSHCTVEADLPANFLASGVCVSKRGLTEMLRLCQEGFPEVQLSIFQDQKAILVEVPDYRCYVRLSTVQYPNYEGVIPSGPFVDAEVQCGAIQKAVRRVMLAADQTRALHLRLGDGTLTLSSRTQGQSEGAECLPLVGPQEGATCALSVNGGYLGDVFSATPTDKLRLRILDAERPMMIVPLGEPEACRSEHVLVPIKDC